MVLINLSLLTMTKSTTFGRFLKGVNFLSCAGLCLLTTSLSFERSELNDEVSRLFPWADALAPSRGLLGIEQRLAEVGPLVSSGLTCRLEMHEDCNDLDTCLGGKSTANSGVRFRLRRGLVSRFGFGGGEGA